MSLTPAMKALGGLATWAYLDAKYGLRSDSRLGRAAARGNLTHRLNSWKGKISLYERFAARVQSTPDNVAYVYEGQTWTWSQIQKGEYCRRVMRKQSMDWWHSKMSKQE